MFVEEKLNLPEFKPHVAESDEGMIKQSAALRL
jgi:hypothetical protein